MILKKHREGEEGLVVHKLPISALEVLPDLSLYHVGPALDHGPLPSFFYFALSGESSLTLDPFNQPIQFMQKKMMRSFSLDLPAHERGLSPLDALKTWAEDYEKGRDPLGEFLDRALKAIDFALEQKLVDPAKMAIGGLSRGGLLAFHLAAQEKRFKNVVAFAPITKLQNAKEFSSLKNHPKVLSYDANHLVDSLYDQRIRLYIGNRDKRVSTRSSFEFLESLVEKGKEKNLKSSSIEMIISPSIGNMGHGTPPDVFKSGADWVLECIT